MLTFFDIDATLITTSRAGVGAMEAAGRELFGPGFVFEGVEFAGRLDPLIVADVLRRNGVAPSPETVARFRAAYRVHLEMTLRDRSRCRALPGVPELLAGLRACDGVVLGLLTGNYSDTGPLKLRACGIDPEWFRVQVWGEDSPHDPPCRDHLPRVGLDRYESLVGRPLEARLATVIGDTPFDIACARAHGCRSLGVATGSYARGELERAGADRVVEDLSETSRIMDWLMRR